MLDKLHVVADYEGRSANNIKKAQLILKRAQTTAEDEYIES